MTVAFIVLQIVFLVFNLAVALGNLYWSATIERARETLKKETAEARVITARLDARIEALKNRR